MQAGFFVFGRRGLLDFSGAFRLGGGNLDTAARGMSEGRDLTSQAPGLLFDFKPHFLSHFFSWDSDFGAMFGNLLMISSRRNRREFVRNGRRTFDPAIPSISSPSIGASNRHLLGPWIPSPKAKRRLSSEIKRCQGRGPVTSLYRLGLRVDPATPHGTDSTSTRTCRTKLDMANS